MARPVRLKALFWRWLLVAAVLTSGVFAFLWLAPSPADRMTAIGLVAVALAAQVVCVAYGFAAFAEPPPEHERPMDAKRFWRLALRTLAGAVWILACIQAPAIGALFVRHVDDAWFGGVAIIGAVVLALMAGWGAAAGLRKPENAG